MTKKNANKDAARARQQRLGGHYLHHFRIVGGNGGTQPAAPLTADDLVGLARDGVLAEAARAEAPLDTTATLYVILDPRDRLGAIVAAAGLADDRGISFEEGRRSVEAELDDLSRRGQGLAFGGLMSISKVCAILSSERDPNEIDKTVELIAHLSTPPPADHLRVLVVMQGTVAATLAPAIKLCWCGHRLSDHRADGACSWIGVPDERPIAGLPPDLQLEARTFGIPMRCPCAGQAILIDGPSRGASRRHRRGRTSN